jgi:hypothetical protein
MKRKVEAALALPLAGVAAAREAVLARWDYAATWRSILEAVERTVYR